MTIKNFINRYFRVLSLAVALPLCTGELLADAEGEIPILARMINHTLETQPDGAVVDWSDGKLGKSGEITVMSTFFSKTGPCRRYRWTMTQKGQSETETVEGTGCRHPDATWARDEAMVKNNPEDSSPAETATSDPAKSKLETAEAGGTAIGPEASAPDAPDAAEPKTETPPVPQSKPKAPVVLVTLPRRSSD